MSLEGHRLHGEWAYTIKPRLLHLPADSPQGLRVSPFPLFSPTLTPDWLIPLNQPVSLPASSQH